MTRNDNRTARKFEKVAAMIERGATTGERNAARNAARTLIRRHGLRACAPSHPLATAEIVGFSWELVDVVEGCWDHNGRNGGTFTISETEKTALFAGLEAYGAKELGRAYRIIRDRYSDGHARGAWVGGNDIKFLNIAKFLFERAFRNVAPSEGFEPADIERFLRAPRPVAA